MQTDQHEVYNEQEPNSENMVPASLVKPSGSPSGIHDDNYTNTSQK